MREFGVAPVATTGDTTTLTDPVWDNADRTPDVVQFVRRVETAAHRATVDDVRPQLPALERLWQLDGPAGAVAELVGAGSDVPADEVAGRRRATRADDLATIIYTSGTTGRPTSGCALTHRNIHADVANAVLGLSSLFNERSRTLLFPPLADSFARLIQVGVVAARATMGHTPDTSNLAAELQEFRPTFLLSVPRVFEKVNNAARQRAHADGKGRAIFDRAERTGIAYSRALDHPRGPGLALSLRHKLFDRLVYGKPRAAFGGRCRACICGRSPLGERLAHLFRGIGVTIHEGHGLTETSPACAVNREDAIRIVKGAKLFAGYRNNPAAAREAVDDDGWLTTGDLGELDDAGYLRVTGRKKELIVTAGGKNVAPAGLEDRPRAHSLISHAVVVGDRQPFIGALVTIDPEALSAWNRAHGKPTGATAADLREDPDLRGEVQKCG